jgi:hypothetical protein
MHKTGNFIALFIDLDLRLLHYAQALHPGHVGLESAPRGAGDR